MWAVISLEMRLHQALKNICESRIPGSVLGMGKASIREAFVAFSMPRNDGALFPKHLFPLEKLTTSHRNWRAISVKKTYTGSHWS